MNKLSDMKIEWIEGKPVQFEPGMAVKANGATFLIGHVNCMLGVCDDCIDFTEEEITHYAQIIDIES
jgi:hypothetical protein